MNKLQAITKSTVFSLLFFFISFCSFAQTTADDAPQMADLMRSNGKIYVVVTVCLIILIGLFLYVASVERKIKKWEKENN